MSGKIDWSRAVEWSTGESATKDGYNYVSSCRKWTDLTGDATVAIDTQTGQILGCEEEDLPFVRNVALSGALCINSLGEVLVGDDYIGGSINVSDNPSEEEIARRFRQQLVDGGLTDDQVAIVDKIWDAQKLNDSRIRLAYFGGRPVVESEFIAFSDDTEMWDRINSVAVTIDARVDDVCEFPHLDHYCPGPNCEPRPGALPSPERNGWFVGPNHGRMERQVALQLYLTDDFTAEQHDVARRKLSDATDAIWSDAGVALL